ncbi:MAG TPA: efflux RND transporter periplasmic adaptor subunit [Thermoanaerobaculia bacterium]|nr:efflux RND transporter periplasmic adaptor subunit [Thermoanaerobaculia bacterium]
MAEPRASSPRRVPRSVKLVVAVALLALAGWGVRALFFAPEGITVTVAAAERGEVAETVTNSRAGTVKARRRARLSPEIGGRVVEAPYSEGDWVPAGAVVLRLDPSVQSAQERVAEREVAASQAAARQSCLQAEQARRELERNRGLAAQGIVSENLLERLESEAATAAAACDAARLAAERAAAALQLARTEQGRTLLRAPFDAVVAQLSAEVGEYVTPSPPGLPMPPVIDLLDPTSLYVSAPMDEVDAARLRPGLPARVSLDPFPGQELAGRVVRVAPFVLDVEQQNRTVEIEVELADPALVARLLPGTSADVEVVLEVREEVLRIPTPALLAGNRVLVVEDGVLAERRVEVGLRNWDWTEVTSGLSAGDRVVTSLDREEVQPGAVVQVEAD